MVVPCGVAAVRAASAAGNVGATAMGLGMGASDLDLTRELFKMQMRQAKRLWTADWAENSVRHGEACMQSAQQHSESQALATATYFQAEKLASQGFKLARDQDSRAYELSWRAEVRESLRDELQNQNSRFNIIMLCDTVCLGCVFSLVAEGTNPIETPKIMLNIYVAFLGLSITLFSISLWFSVIVVRRLYDHTASILERKLFAQSDDLQQAWQDQLNRNLPTGPHEMHLVNAAYEQWIAQYIDPFGKWAIHMMSIGVVTMFVTAGLLTHNRYLIEFEAPVAVYIFWVAVGVTSLTVLGLKISEDSQEKRKVGVYDRSWQDESTIETGPFAKIIKAAEELFSQFAVGLGSTERMEAMDSREKLERNYCVKTQSLHHRVESLRNEAHRRAKTRKELVQLLTTASEEMDALPEDLISNLNKMIHDIDEADARTAELVGMESEGMLAVKGSSRKGWNRGQLEKRAPMPAHPIDAQRIPISLPSLRSKLGGISITSAIRVRNLSDKPLRLKSGMQLKEGKYIKAIKAEDRNGESTSFQLYPGAEIPPRTEIMVVARNNGAWVPTSGVTGELVYTNKEETWVFHIHFRNGLVTNTRNCRVEAIPVSNEEGDSSSIFSSQTKENEDEYWEISKEELDHKVNNEVVVSIDMSHGAAASVAQQSYRQSHISLKSGFLMKNKAFGLRLQWQQRWVVLTPTDLVYSEGVDSKAKSTINLKHITDVRSGSDLTHRHIIEIQVDTTGRDPFKFAAPSQEERDVWLQAILTACGKGVRKVAFEQDRTSSDADSVALSWVGAVECVESEAGIRIMDDV